MTLITEYNDGRDATLVATVSQALLHRAVTILLAGATGTAAEQRSIRFATRVANNPLHEAGWVTPMFTAGGITTQSNDTTIQNAVNTNWDALAWTRDQTYGV